METMNVLCCILFSWEDMPTSLGRRHVRAAWREEHEMDPYLSRKTWRHSQWREAKIVSRVAADVIDNERMHGAVQHHALQHEGYLHQHSYAVNDAHRREGRGGVANGQGVGSVVMEQWCKTDW